MGVDLSDGPHRGTIHVNWADLRNGDRDIFHMKSSDGGDTWAEVALGATEWAPEYPMDYYASAGGPWSAGAARRKPKPPARRVKVEIEPEKDPGALNA